MKRSAAWCVLVLLSLVFAGCSGSSSSQTTVNDTTTGTLSVTGSPTLAGALSAPAIRSAPKATIPGTPSSVKMKAYKVYLARNADCSSPVLVGDKASTADYQDLMAAAKPVLFTAATVTPGTYHCMVLKVSDVLKFTPDAAAQAASGGVCVAGAEISFDIHKTEIPAELWYDLDSGGTNTGDGTLATAVEQTVFLFASTDPSAILAHNSLIVSTQVGTIVNPVVITAGQTTKTAFVVDTTDRMSVIPYNDGVTTADRCWLEGFDASFVTP